MSSTYGIEEARGRLGDLVTAAQQGTDVILTRNGRAAARLIRHQEDTVTSTRTAELAKQVLVYGDDHGDETQLHALRPDLAALAGAAAWLQAEHNETLTFDPMADDIDAHTAPGVQALHDAYLRALRRLAEGVTTP